MQVLFRSFDMITTYIPCYLYRRIIRRLIMLMSKLGIRWMKLEKTLNNICPFYHEKCSLHYHPMIQNSPDCYM